MMPVFRAPLWCLGLLAVLHGCAANGDGALSGANGDDITGSNAGEDGGGHSSNGGGDNNNGGTRGDDNSNGGNSGNTGSNGPKDCKKTCEEGECGFISDGCGDVIECLSECPEGQGCGIDATKPSQCAFPPSDCTPKTAVDVCSGKCGLVSDGCADVILCDAGNGGVSCSPTQSCGGYAGHVMPNQCVDNPSCTPKTCQELGFMCGLAGDGCGELLDCTAVTGGCAAGQVCGSGASSNTCVTKPTCTAITPEIACANTCGKTGDGCGGVIDCQASPTTQCPTGTTCGGSGIPGQCGNGGGGGNPPTCTKLDPVAQCAGRCGFASDGCGGVYTCANHGGATCNANNGESCGGGGVPGVCGKPVCVPKTQQQACPGAGGLNSCGRVGDGCGGLIDCGTCLTDQLCGIDVPNLCGNIPQCTPIAVATACAGKCGIVPNGCGGTYTCTAANGGVSCTGSEYCGATLPNTCGVPPTTCTPRTCASLGHSCGLASDGCGHVLNCWPGCAESNPMCAGACGEAQACLADPNTGSQTCVTGTGGCTGPLCGSVPTCSPNTLTRLTGTVQTPGRVGANGAILNQIPVPNAVVYIPANPDATLPAIFQGVQANNAASCGRCEDEELVADGETILASGVTDYKGEFTLEGRIPVGVAFELVVKVGKWRRVVQVPANVARSCQSTPLASTYTRLPKNRSDGLTGTHLPRVAISTGDVDEMECVFRSIGVDDSEFTVPSGTGRFHMYRANGARMANSQGRDVSIADTQLFASDATINGYDMVVFDCEGAEQRHTAAEARVRNYVNAGGRMFASHWSYVWVRYDAQLGRSADWNLTSGEDFAQAFVSLPTGTTQRAGANPIKSLVFRNWLDWQGALDGSVAGRLSNPATPQFRIQDPRDLPGSNVGASTDEWVYRHVNDPSDRAHENRVQQLSFNTPYGSAEANICGRVAYSSFHVAEADNDSLYFPGVCSNGALSSQEKVLVYMLFDLGACVSEGEPPRPPECTPRTATDICPNINDACGFISDGCGGVVDCEGCSGGFYCDGTSCKPQECTPATCASLGFNCGAHADGCGGIARNPQGVEGCGNCLDNQICGLGGPGVCGTPSCVPIPIATACPPGWCGQVSDGCGGIHNCGTCAPGQVCGGGGPNVCGPGSCTPIPIDRACKDLNCGVVSDGCGGTHHCGDCMLPDTCGGGGKPNVCGHPPCTPITKEEACKGLDCGWVGDGCGGVIDCGDCPDGRICGGKGPNLCGADCEPTTCAKKGAECGKIGDDCGKVIDCGPCPPDLVCGAAGPNKCGGGVCTPKTCAAVNAECGLIGDGCGNIVDCGKCTKAGESCGGAGVPNQCDPGSGGCDEISCRDQGIECGAAGDGCGGLLDCGGCDPGESCRDGKCIPIVQ